MPTRYAFDRFRLRHLLDDLAFRADSPGTGELLPNHTLVRPDGTEVDLRSHAAGRPLVLVTGSITCPVTADFVPRMAGLEERFGDRFAFALVYAREAHPGERIPQPRTMEEKREHARALQQTSGVTWPVLVDDLDGSLHRQLDAKPTSLHVVAPDGEILYRALFAADRDVLGALERIAAGEAPPSPEATSFVRPALGSIPHVHDVLTAAGRRSYLDVLRAAPPMAALGYAAHLLRPRTDRASPAASAH